MSNYCEPHQFRPGPDEACPYCLCDRAFQEVRTLTGEASDAFQAGWQGGFKKAKNAYSPGYYEAYKKFKVPVSTGRDHE